MPRSCMMLPHDTVAAWEHCGSEVGAACPVLAWEQCSLAGPWRADVSSVSNVGVQGPG